MQETSQFGGTGKCSDSCYKVGIKILVKEVNPKMTCMHTRFVSRTVKSVESKERLHLIFLLVFLYRMLDESGIFQRIPISVGVN